VVTNGQLQPSSNHPLEILCNGSLQTITNGLLQPSCNHSLEIICIGPLEIFTNPVVISY
jgi:hypothetical protein